jgi:hypothetical protein
VDGEGDHVVGGVGREGVDGEFHQLGRGEVTVPGGSAGSVRMVPSPRGIVLLSTRPSV